MSHQYDTGSLKGRKLAQIGLTVCDLERSRRFYRDTLGLTLLFDTGGMLFFELAGLRLMIGSENSRAGEPGGSIVYFDAPDVDTLGPALEEKGVAFLGPATVVQRTDTHELKLREFLDPDGNTLALMGMVKR